MKKTEACKPPGKKIDDLLPEYKFDYSKARPNRFAGRVRKEDVTVALDPDVSEVFTTSESANTAEDAEDLTAFEARAHEPNLRFVDVLKDFRQRGVNDESDTPEAGRTE